MQMKYKCKTKNSLIYTNKQLMSVESCDLLQVSGGKELTPATNPWTIKHLL